MRSVSLRAAAALAGVLALGGPLWGCGKASQSPGTGGASVVDESVPAPGGVAHAPPGGSVSVVTKNTARLGGGGPQADAAAVARATYPGLTAATKPQAIVVVDARDWPAALAAASLASAPLGAPLLFADGDALPAVSAQAMAAMHPLGAPALGGAQVIRVATAASVPDGYAARTVAIGADAAASAADVAQLLQAARGEARRVIVVSAQAPRALQMPAAGLAAESGAPILFVSAVGVPAPTASALGRLHHPTIYVVAPGTVSRATAGVLARYGHVVPIPSAGGEGAAALSGAVSAAGAVENAISVARFGDGSFGWNIHEAGHGLVFASVSRPLDAPAAAPLSAHGDFGPLLLLEGSSLPAPLARYLSDVEPGYTRAIQPVRGVYNHGWLIGDESAISAVEQAELDALLEIAPRAESTVEAPTAPE